MESVEEEVQGTESAHKRPGLYIVLLLAAVACCACAFVFMRRQPPAQETASSPSGGNRSAPGDGLFTQAGLQKAILGKADDRLRLPADSAWPQMATPAVSSVGPPNVAVAARRLREHGLKRLAVSDCSKAQWYFGSAFEMLQEQAAQDGSGNATLTDDMVALLGDRGFALVCANRYSEGLAFIEESSLLSLQSSETYMLNALGYARFRLQDYARAGHAFEAGIRSDPLNPLLWNNLAAAKMAEGDFPAADDALYHAWDKAELRGEQEKLSEHYIVDSYQQQLIRENIRNLACRADGNRADLGCPEVEQLTLPAVELWWGGARFS